MAKDFELGMTLNYASSWTFVDAMREFFQNCIDESVQHPNHKFTVVYDSERGLIRLGNTNCALEKQSLLMGSTTKASDRNTIGQHGEGYKVATVVLMRTNHSLKIWNTSEKECWEAKVVKSRRYKTEVCNFSVVKNTAPMDVTEVIGVGGLLFDIGGVTPEEWDAVVDSNLWLQGDVSCYTSDRGSILLDKKQSGKVYVNGLFVEKIDNTQYGYNFKPDVLDLDRDRHTLKHWDFLYSVAMLISRLPVDQINEVKNAPECSKLSTYTDNFGSGDEVESDIKDLPYVERIAKREEVQQQVYDDSYKKFHEKYGEDTIPVVTNEEFNAYAKAGYTCQLLNESDYTLVSRSQYFNKVELEADPDETFEGLVENLNDWFNQVKGMLTQRQAYEGQRIISRIYEYTNLVDIEVAALRKNKEGEEENNGKVQEEET